MSVCLAAKFVVTVSLSGNPAVSFSVSVSVRDTIYFSFCLVFTVCPEVICPDCKHGVE